MRVTESDTPYQGCDDARNGHIPSGARRAFTPEDAPHHRFAMLPVPAPSRRCSAARSARVDLVALDLRAEVQPVARRQLVLHPRVLAEFECLLLMAGGADPMKLDRYGKRALSPTTMSARPSRMPS